MLKLTHLKTTLLIFLTTNSSSFAMEELPESPTSLIRKNMFLEEGVKQFKVPQDVQKLMCTKLYELNRIKIKTTCIKASCPPLSILEEHKEAIQGLDILHNKMIVKPGMCYSIQRLSKPSPKTFNKFQFPFKFTTAQVVKEQFMPNLPLIKILCYYRDASKIDERIGQTIDIEMARTIRVLVQPLYSDGGAVDLLDYDIEIVKNESAHDDIKIIPGKSPEKFGTMTSCITICASLAPEDISFVLTPK